MSLFMCASVATLGATTAALCMLILRRAYLPPQRWPLIAYLAAFCGYRASYLLVRASEMSEACAMQRELFFAFLACVYAGGVLYRTDRTVRVVGFQSALAWMLGVTAAWCVAMALPGEHNDYREMMITAVVPTLLLTYALLETEDKLDLSACSGLALVFLAQLLQYVGWEFGISWGRIGAWLHTIAALTAMWWLTSAALRDR